MSDEQILEVLNKFSDVLEVSNMWNYAFRWVGWLIIQGLSWLVDGLENITDTILGMKTFFASPKVQEFVTMIQPFLYILLAFSFLYIGYCLIFQRKINREQIAMNIFISIAVLLVLNTSMMKADKFTDQAIKAIDASPQASISEKIIKDHMTDIAQYDVNGWKSTELKERNKISEENIRNIDITETVDEDFEVAEDKKLSDNGQDIVQNEIKLLPSGQEVIVELDNGFFDFFKEHYYRWQWDFWTITISLLVTGMALLFTSIKLAKLCYELAFNYILATIIAPADVAGGQMLKQVLKSILNTFLIIIMIFMSMKLYLIGTEYIAANIKGPAYLIALIAISLALIDGPVLCERLFGIDAGLKSGWSAAAASYAAVKSGAKGLSTVGKAAATGTKGALAVGGGVAGALSGLKDAVSGQEEGSGNQAGSLFEEMKNDSDKNQSFGGTSDSSDKGISPTGLHEDTDNDPGGIEESTSMAADTDANDSDVDTHSNMNGELPTSASLAESSSSGSSSQDESGSIPSAKDQNNSEMSSALHGNQNESLSSGLTDQSSVGSGQTKDGKESIPRENTSVPLETASLQGMESNTPAKEGASVSGKGNGESPISTGKFDSTSPSLASEMSPDPGVG
ncbi:pLS20_p028 family conjugation system transmembrane protein, partial [Bacillus sp. JJ722]|uniref:pLS20_p028 family conjugation system transmembrane protein n=1 Tax=Bacillus sp. JJ722 TaxID=3122973 RepID=UPI002FFEFA23